MTNHGLFHSRLAIVLGCGDMGSAVAWSLHRAGFAVALTDEADPAWHRRGKTFTNAWYVGNAELDGEGACFCASLKSMPSILRRRMIAATTWSWQGIATAFETSVLVDARGSKRRGQARLCGRVPVTIAVGSEAADVRVDVALPDTIAVASLMECQMAAPPNCDIAATSSNPVSPMVEARRHGRFITDRRIGDSVRTGEIVGAIGSDPVEAPASGVLMGIAARGARIVPGDVVVEVDAVAPPHGCYGIAESSRQVALSVLAECRIRLGSSSCCNTVPAKFAGPLMHEEYPQCAKI